MFYRKGLWAPSLSTTFVGRVLFYDRNASEGEGEVVVALEAVAVVVGGGRGG